jgi:hypothetical protein
MAQLGHTDPTMTLGIYARVMLDGEAEREALRKLVDGGAGSLAAEEYRYRLIVDAAGGAPRIPRVDPAYTARCRN